MKIKNIRSQVVRMPLDEPLAGGPPYSRSHNVFVILRLETEAEIEGIGATLKHAVDHLGEMILGDDPLRIDAVTQKLRSAAARAGPGDFIFVPPYVPHQEINAADQPLVCVVVRSGQEPIVVNLDIPAVEIPEEVPWIDPAHPGRSH